jgi:hypothetical protein
MAPKTPLSAEQRTEIRRLAGSTTVREISRRTGASKSAVQRALADERDGPVDAPQDSPAAPPDAADEVPETVPPGTSLEIIHGWQARVERAAQEAERVGNLGALSSLTSRAATLIEAERRATPAAPPDPNENPDFIEEARRAREKVFGELESFLASQVKP